MHTQRSTRPRLNDEILAHSVRVIGEAGEQIGVMPTQDARRLALSRNLDLIEVTAAATPPVCRIADYGRFKYDQSKKTRAARRTRPLAELKEVQLTPRTEQHDYETKLRKAEQMLARGAKVRVSVFFRGREISYSGLGTRMLDRIALDLRAVATLEAMAKLEGKRMSILLAPVAFVHSSAQ